MHSRIVARKCRVGPIFLGTSRRLGSRTYLLRSAGMPRNVTSTRRTQRRRSRNLAHAACTCSRISSDGSTSKHSRRSTFPHNGESGSSGRNAGVLQDRNNLVLGNSVSVRLRLGGRRSTQTQNK